MLRSDTTCCFCRDSKIPQPSKLLTDGSGPTTETPPAMGPISDSDLYKLFASDRGAWDFRDYPFTQALDWSDDVLEGILPPTLSGDFGLSSASSSSGISRREDPLSPTSSHPTGSVPTDQTSSRIEQEASLKGHDTTPLDRASTLDQTPANMLAAAHWVDSPVHRYEILGAPWGQTAAGTGSREHAERSGHLNTAPHDATSILGTTASRRQALPETGAEEHKHQASSNRIPCPRCNSDFAGKKTLFRHVAKQHAEMAKLRAVCPLCEKVLKNRHGVIIHMSVAHTDYYRQHKYEIRRMIPHVL